MSEYHDVKSENWRNAAVPVVCIVEIKLPGWKYMAGQQKLE